jgi:hypothetical protein
MQGLFPSRLASRNTTGLADAALKTSQTSGRGKVMRGVQAALTLMFATLWLKPHLGKENANRVIGCR